MTPDTRDDLKSLRDYCEQQVSAYQTRIEALQINDATQQSIERNRRDLQRWAAHVAALDAVLSEG